MSNAADLVAGGVSATVAVVTMADAALPGVDSYVGDVVGIGGLAGVVVFLFRWAQQQLAEARAAGADAVREAKLESERDLEAMTVDRDQWRDRYLKLVEGPQFPPPTIE